MSTTNHPENQNPNGLGNLGQISTQGQTLKDDERECTECGEIHTTGLKIDGKFHCMNCLEKSQFNPKPWVIVENPGTDLEDIVTDFATYREAHVYFVRNYEDDDTPADIMRRRDDGVLTTEF